MIFPEAGLTKHNQWRFILQEQSDDNNAFRQGIRVETCLYVSKIITSTYITI